MPTRQTNASCFIFFAAPHFLKTILAKRTSGTFGFARHTSQRFAKPKEPFFRQRTVNNNKLVCELQATKSRKNSNNTIIRLAFSTFKKKYNIQ